MELEQKHNQQPIYLSNLWENWDEFKDRIRDNTKISIRNTVCKIDTSDGNAIHFRTIAAAILRNLDQFEDVFNYEPVFFIALQVKIKNNAEYVLNQVMLLNYNKEICRNGIALTYNPKYDWKEKPLLLSNLVEQWGLFSLRVFQNDIIRDELQPRINTERELEVKIYYILDNWEKFRNIFNYDYMSFLAIQNEIHIQYKGFLSHVCKQNLDDNCIALLRNQLPNSMSIFQNATEVSCLRLARESRYGHLGEKSMFDYLPDFIAPTVPGFNNLPDDIVPTIEEKPLLDPSNKSHLLKEESLQQRITPLVPLYFEDVPIQPSNKSIILKEAKLGGHLNHRVSEQKVGRLERAKKEDINYQVIDNKGKNIEIEIYHPGELLEEELLERNIPFSNFANMIKLTGDELKAIFDGKSDMSAMLCISIGIALNMDGSFWYRLQIAYDYQVALKNYSKLSSDTRDVF